MRKNHVSRRDDHLFVWLAERFLYSRAAGVLPTGRFLAGVIQRRLTFSDQSARHQSGRSVTTSRSTCVRSQFSLVLQYSATAYRPVVMTCYRCQLCPILWWFEIYRTPSFPSVCCWWKWGTFDAVRLLPTPPHPLSCKTYELTLILIWKHDNDVPQCYINRNTSDEIHSSEIKFVF